MTWGLGGGLTLLSAETGGLTGQFGAGSGQQGFTVDGWICGASGTRKRRCPAVVDVGGWGPGEQCGRRRRRDGQQSADERITKETRQRRETGQRQQEQLDAERCGEGRVAGDGCGGGQEAECPQSGASSSGRRSETPGGRSAEGPPSAFPRGGHGRPGQERLRVREGVPGGPRPGSVGGAPGAGAAFSGFCCGGAKQWATARGESSDRRGLPVCVCLLKR